MKALRRLLPVLMLCAPPLLAAGPSAATSAEMSAGMGGDPSSVPPAEVMLIGTFHFANPGRDVVRTEQIDVTQPAPQAYLDAFAQRLCEFRPTVVLVEADPSRDGELQAQLEAWQTGKASLSSNEVQQLGFRVARACEVGAVHGFDESEVGWRGDLLFDYLEKSDPALQASLQQEIDAITHDEAEAQRALDLQALLRRTNDPSRDRLNMDFYLLTNVAGAGQGYAGADATASWWHRNFRMYANIQTWAQPGERVLVIAGQGHTAVLKDLLAIDRRLVARDVRPLL